MKTVIGKPGGHLVTSGDGSERKPNWTNSREITTASTELADGSFPSAFALRLSNSRACLRLSGDCVVLGKCSTLPRSEVSSSIVLTQLQTVCNRLLNHDAT